MKNKVCNTCKRELPATTQYFYKFCHSKDGFKSSCKECQGGSFKVRKNPPKNYRYCSDCGKLLKETEENFVKFYDKRNNKYRFKSHCKECGKIRSKKWRKNNKERYLEYAKEYRQTPKGKAVDKKYKETHKELIKERKRDYRERHKEQIQAYDRKRRNTEETRERVLNFSREWRKNNKEKVKTYNREYAKENSEYFVKATQKRRARLNKAKSDYTLKQWEDAKKYFNYECAYCSKKMKRLTQEHVIPLYLGGSYTVENIIPACKSCNSSKHTSNMQEWYSRQTFYNEERYEKILNYLKSKAIPR